MPPTWGSSFADVACRSPTPDITSTQAPPPTSHLNPDAFTMPTTTPRIGSTGSARRGLGAVAVAAAFSWLGGCGGEAATEAPGAFLDDLPRIHLEETARIGSTEDPDYGFSRIGQVQVGPDGNVWVAETQDMEVRVYSPEGALLRRVGRRGAGPGEFSHGLSRLGFVGDTVWVWDDLARRLGLFTIDGRVLGTVRVDPVEAELFGPGERSRLGPGVLDAGGYLLGVRGGEMIAQGPPQRDTASIPLVRFTLEGTVVDTVGQYEVAPRKRGGHLLLPGEPARRQRRVG